MVSTINELGDKAVHTVLDFLDPVKQVKTTIADSTESIRAFRNGEIVHGLTSAGQTAMDVACFVPFGKMAVSELQLGVKGVLGVGSRFGFFGGKSVVTNSSPLRAQIEENIAQTRKGINRSFFLSHSAREHQFSIGYLPDEWGIMNLKKGDVIYGGLPGQSSYYTSLDTVLSSQGNKTLLYDALQISPHPIQGFRSQIGIYQVSRDMRVPHGIVSANPSYGIGGGQQFLVRNFSTSLELRNQLSLEEFYEHQLQRNSIRP